MTGFNLKVRYLPGFLLLGIFIPACGFRAPMDTFKVNAVTQQITETQSHSPPATKTTNPALENSPELLLCQEGFADRELREPYQRYDGQPRYTLSDEEFFAYLELMGIESI